MTFWLWKPVEQNKYVNFDGKFCMLGLHINYRMFFMSFVMYMYVVAIH